MFATVLAARSKTQVLFIHIILQSLWLVKTCVGSRQVKTADQKPMELPKTQFAGFKEGISAFLFQSALSEVVERGNGILLFFAKPLQDTLADRKPPYERDMAFQLVVE